MLINSVINFLATRAYSSNTSTPKKAFGSYKRMFLLSLLILSISSSVRSKSKTLMFSQILLGVTDFGMTAVPLCSPQRRQIWATVLKCFFASSLRTL